MDETQTIYWKHISRNYLNPGVCHGFYGLQKRSFYQAGTKLKTKWKKQKSFLRAQKWGVGEEWKEEMPSTLPPAMMVSCRRPYLPS
jgi:hypothetical protein